ncbi:MAG: hypothetical protein JST51_01670 [Armatimonadetes bacterium]|nr:hypothetical protein [Armatimonadota bacterium]
MIHCDECKHFKSATQLAMVDFRPRRWTTAKERAELNKRPVVEEEPIVYCDKGRGLSFLIPQSTMSTEWGHFPAGGRCGLFEATGAT